IGETVEKLILRPEHDGRPQDRRLRESGPHRLLAAPLARDIAVGGAGVRPDARHMNERPRAGSLGGPRNRLRAISMNRLEALSPRLALDPAEVDDDLRALDRGFDGGGKAHVRLHRLHLPDYAVGG